MDHEPASTVDIAQANAAETRKAWHRPMIEDADIGGLTSGGGNSGMEGTPFLKTGS